MRKARAKKRMLLPDPKFQSQEVTRFVNNLMLHGKKSIAYSIFYDAIAIVDEKVEENGLDAWRKALENVTPQVEVRSRRVGGATFQIPQPIRDDRKTSMGMKWLILYAKKRNKEIKAISILYHTKWLAFRVINLPNTPVSPKMTTIRCSDMFLCFPIMLNMD